MRCARECGENEAERVCLVADDVGPAKNNTSEIISKSTLE